MAQGYNQQQYLFIAPQVLICKAAATDVTTYTQSISAGYYYTHYMGRAYMDATGINVLSKITTTGTALAWHQVGVFQGPSDFPLGPNATPFTLTSLGYSNLTGSGITNCRITANIPKGTDLWIAFGASSNGGDASGPAYRCMTADKIQSGLFQVIPSGTTQLKDIISITGPFVSNTTTHKPLWIAAYLGEP
jgi:hypothetical protein